MLGENGQYVKHREDVCSSLLASTPPVIVAASSVPNLPFPKMSPKSILGWCLADGYRKGDQRHPMGPCGSRRTFALAFFMNTVEQRYNTLYEVKK